MPVAGPLRVSGEWPCRIAIPKTGGVIVVRDVKTLKRPYTAPSFHVTDINAVKAKLEAELTSTDQHAQQMLAIAKQLQEKKSARSKVT
jgi:hypothetical protein